MKKIKITIKPPRCKNCRARIQSVGLPDIEKFLGQTVVQAFKKNKFVEIILN